MGRKRKRAKSQQQMPASPAEIPVKEKTADKKKRKRQPAPRMRDHPNWPLTVLAGAGMVLTAYLVLSSWLGQHPLLCKEGSSCDIVQQSRWGTFLLLPTALWGFLTYAVLTYTGLRVRDPGRHWKTAWIVSLVGFSYSLYLNIISLFVIRAACVYCLSSLAIMTAIFGLVLFQRPAGLPGFNFMTWAGETIVIALVIVGGMHLHYSGVFHPTAGPEDPFLMGLAEHLTEEKAVVYGAFW